MKLINFKCLSCGQEKETELLTTEEYNEILEKIEQGIGPVYLCDNCGQEMILYNWARNSRWKFMDN